LKSGSTVKLRYVTAEQTYVPNHHAHYPGFAGLSGLLAAASMAVGRQTDARLAERLSGLEPGGAVVDVGCGPGSAVRRAARLGASAVGVDPAPVMLRVARILTRPSDRVRFARGTAEALPLPDASASVVWSIASVHHWADVDAGLRETRRVLRPGGRLVAIERRTRPGAHGHASHGWNDEQASAFAQRCLEHGFSDPTVGLHTHGRRTTLSVAATAPTPAS
jgi:ubiquinone/menaquinone biosynthesis C-methylase UbiE